MPSWHGAQLKKRDNFTFYIFYNGAEVKQFSYGLHDRGPIYSRGWEFFSLPSLSGLPVDHSFSYLMGVGSSVPRVKQLVCEAGPLTSI